jgi:hypothetical protein
VWPSVWAGIAQAVQRLATGWTVRGSNPSVGVVFRTRSKRPSGPGVRGAALTTHPHPAPWLKEEYNYISTPPMGLPGLLNSDVSLIYVIGSPYKHFCMEQTRSCVGTKSVANSIRANNFKAGKKVFAL